ncbi:hypothetical protein H7F51_18170 [Novosphingobium flavum]|uniref:2-keto-4-pentenoate hydratase n=1 Tax=Novosphingobium flavum TaxID=1778672 RepID=A0A7X1FUY2_9SPHN|nr:hypothetical protein [Novosphingobium flavum]MBC2667448.1 hypothetical protein [Novosphingobium flavum]
MTRMGRYLPGVGLAAVQLLLASCTTASPQGGAYLRGFEAAESAGRPFAPITDSLPYADQAEAYRLQARLVARRVARGDKVAGYKGGLMSEASMRGRNVGEPLVGVLFASGRAASGDTVSLCGYRKASFEQKLGFVFARSVATLPADPAALAGAVGQVVPVVDLPDIAYRDPDHYGAVDMVAANISAARYVRGAAAAPAGTDLNGLKVSMTRDGQPLTSGFGRESMGEQWGSLHTAVRLILRSGRRIKAGDLVITGKIGDRGWLPPGDYRSDYGPLGVVAFRVAPCMSALAH